MAVLGSVTTILGAVAATEITPFADFPWAMILNGAMSGIGFYALRIILLTVCLKLVLFPLDLFQRYKMRKNQLITMRIKPQIEKLEKAYGSNPRVLQQKQAELNKREGMSYLSSCLPMIVTLVVFMWLWWALQTTANYKQFDNYVRIYDVYADAYDQAVGDEWLDATTHRLTDAYGEDFRVAYDEAFVSAYDENAEDRSAAVSAAADAAFSAASAVECAERETAYYTLYIETYSTWFARGFEDTSAYSDTEKAADLAAEAGSNSAADVVEQYCQTVAQNDVYDFYFHEGRYAESGGYESDSFLWIKDIWSPDTPWSNSLAPTQAEFETAVGTYATDPSRSGLDEAELERIVGSYETVMARVIDEGEYGTNGFLVLPVLAVALNVVSQIIMRRQQKKSGQDMAAGQNAGCMKAMVFVMPVIMGYFALSYCSAFTLYMVTNSAMSLLINLVSSAISKKMIPIGGEKTGAATAETVERYGRPDPNSKGKK